MFWLIHGTYSRRSTVGIVADWCPDCDRVVGADLIRELYSYHVFYISYTRWRHFHSLTSCWICKCEQLADENQFDQVLPLDGADSMSIRQLLRATNSRLADELEAARRGEPRPAPPIKAPAPTIKKASRNPFRDVPWMSLLTFLFGAGAVVCGIVSAEKGLRSYVQWTLPLVLASFWILALGLAGLKRLTRRKMEFGPRKLPRRVFWGALFVVMGLGVTTTGVPELACHALGWPINSNAYELVVSPGDTVTVELEDTVSSVQAYWAGQGQIELLDPYPGIPRVAPVRTRGRTWPSTIHYDKNDSAVSETHLWVEVEIPNITEVLGKTLRYRVRMSVEYPYSADKRTFTELQGQIDRTFDLRLTADPAGSRQHRSLMWWCFGIAAGLVAPTAIWLCVYEWRMIAAERAAS